MTKIEALATLIKEDISDPFIEFLNEGIAYSDKMEPYSLFYEAQRKTYKAIKEKYLSLIQSKP